MQGSVLLFLEFQRRRVDAVAQPGGGGAVWEDVAEVRAATSAQGFGAHHAVAGVGLLRHGFGVPRLIDARPAAAGVVLRGRGKQRLAAGGAAVLAGFMVVPVGAGERPFGAVLAQDAVLLRGQFGTPFGFGLGFVNAHGSPPVSKECTRKPPEGHQGQAAAVSAAATKPATHYTRLTASSQPV